MMRKVFLLCIIFFSRCHANFPIFPVTVGAAAMLLSAETAAVIGLIGQQETEKMLRENTGKALGYVIFQAIGMYGLMRLGKKS